MIDWVTFNQIVFGLAIVVVFWSTWKRGRKGSAVEAALKTYEKSLNDYNGSLNEHEVALKKYEQSLHQYEVTLRELNNARY